MSILAVGLLALGGTGCGKKTSVTNPKTLDEGLSALSATLSTGKTPVAQSNFFALVQRNVRYGKYVEALQALDGVDHDPSLSPDQKKLADQVFELLKAKVQAGGQ